MKETKEFNKHQEAARYYHAGRALAACGQYEEQHLLSFFLLQI